MTRPTEVFQTLINSLRCNVTAGHKSQAQVLLEHVSRGVTTSTELAKAIGVSKSQISRLTAKLLNEKKLTKRGRIYSLPKTRKFTSDSAPQIASQSAPVHEEKASEGKERQTAKTALDGHFGEIPRHAVETLKNRAFHTLSREH